MKATAHWLERKGHTEKSPSMHFDEVFTEQIVKTGKIEESRTIRRFFQRTKQGLMQPWMVEMVKRMLRSPANRVADAHGASHARCTKDTRLVGSIGSCDAGIHRRAA